MKKVAFLFTWLVACEAANTVDRKKELDFAYPSIEFNSFEQIKEEVIGSWTGNRSLLTKDSTGGDYTITIRYDEEDLFTFIERKIENDKEIDKTVAKCMLYEFDSQYTFETDNNHLRIHYLSDKQLKLNDLLFERTSEN